MDEIILNKYGIKFENKIIEIPIGSPKEVFKTLTTTIENASFMTSFISDYKDIPDLLEFVLLPINSAIENNIEEESDSNSGIGLFITREIVKMIDIRGEGSYLNPDFSIPTVEFKEVIMAWKEFLETPPFHGETSQ